MVQIRWSQRCPRRLVFSHHHHPRTPLRSSSVSPSCLPLSLRTGSCPRFTMAEVVGILASSIQIGGLIGTIANAGLQIQTLYHEIQDASEEVAFGLQELQILSGILQAADSISPNAQSLCKRCLSELHNVLDELQSQIYRSRGFKKIVASAKVIVKKDVLQKLERRLERSVQLLMLANQIHMSSTQSLVLLNQNTMSSTQALILHNQDSML